MLEPVDELRADDVFAEELRRELDDDELDDPDELDVELDEDPDDAARELLALAFERLEVEALLDVRLVLAFGVAFASGSRAAPRLTVCATPSPAGVAVSPVPVSESAASGAVAVVAVLAVVRLAASAPADVSATPVPANATTAEAAPTRAFVGSDRKAAGLADTERNRDG